MNQTNVLWELINDWADEFAERPSGYDPGYGERWIDASREHTLVLATRVVEWLRKGKV